MRVCGYCCDPQCEVQDRNFWVNTFTYKYQAEVVGVKLQGNQIVEYFMAVSPSFYELQPGLLSAISGFISMIIVIFATKEKNVCNKSFGIGFFSIIFIYQLVIKT